MVTVKPGDAINHMGTEFRVAKLEVYRALGLTSETEIVR
jgi:hypothetical protein